VAGCGGSDSSSSSSEETASETTSGGETQESTVSLAGAEFLGKGETGWGIRPAGGAEQEKAEAAGVEAGEEKKQVKLPEGITVGYINYLNGLESGDRLHDSAVLAAAQLGWTVKNCDAKGTPSLFVQCGTSLLAEGVDAIIESGIEAGQLGPVMTKAKAAGVPVVQEGGGGVPQATFAGNYGPNEATAGEILSKALIAKLSEQSGNPEVAIHDFPARWGAERTEVFEKELSEQSKIKIADSVETDPVDPVGFTRSTVTTELTENPNLSAFWVTFDVPGQVAGQTVAQKFPGKEFPEKPLVATFHADHGTVALMAAGAIDMVSEVNYDAAAWMAVDGVAQELAREEQMSQENQPKYPVIGDPFTYQIVTTENLPPEDGYAAPKWDVPSYFIAKWNTEYQK
jgi:ABC-type sugar transport system substrate-binding protein